MREVFTEIAGNTELEVVLEKDVLEPPSVRARKAPGDGPEPPPSVRVIEAEGDGPES
jgi:hypothetical protein